ncbi:MAG: FHA domain-containing protein [Acidobacteriota bacterium]|nr:FHA domain-containing protein [Acidobacteriota bacterium]
MARLRIIGGDGLEQVVDVREQRLQIGRGRDNDVVLPDPEKGVSRTHAELRLENDRYVVVDLQSQNGTYLNGARIERAEVPYGAEIAVGGYRLTLLRDGASGARPAARIPRVDPADDMRATGPHAPPAYAPAPAPPPAAAAGPAPWAMGLVVAILVIMALAATVWVAGNRQQANAPGNGAAAQTPPPSAPVAVPADVRQPESPAPAVAERPAGSLDTGVDPRPAAPRPAGGAGTNAGAARVGRRPGESVDAWRSRGAALQMRYEYSTAALTRGDFAAAAGGFEAILIEEPGFLDSAGLLVQAQSGLRSSARRLYLAGQKLEEAGDWVGALQKYEQARQIFSGVDGLAVSLKQVRGKLHTAGTAAFDEGRQHEAAGRRDEALKAYDKAIQWLPPDDPNRQAARTRVEQLKRTIEEYARGQQ